MANKKNTAPATSPHANKARTHKAAKTEATQTTEAVPSETASPAELLPTEAPTDSTPETLPPVTSRPVPVEAARASQAQEAPPSEAASLLTATTTKLSALDAAAKVLSETGQAMNCAELIAAMAAKGYWSSPQGRTPASTLYAALTREIHTKGENARFRKSARGQFLLQATL